MSDQAPADEALSSNTNVPGPELSARTVERMPSEKHLSELAPAVGEAKPALEMPGPGRRGRTTCDVSPDVELSDPAPAGSILKPAEGMPARDARRGKPEARESSASDGADRACTDDRAVTVGSEGGDRRPVAEHLPNVAARKSRGRKSLGSLRPLAAGGAGHAICEDRPRSAGAELDHSTGEPRTSHVEQDGGGGRGRVDDHLNPAPEGRGARSTHGDRAHASDAARSSAEDRLIHGRVEDGEGGQEIGDDRSGYAAEDRDQESRGTHSASVPVNPVDTALAHYGRMLMDLQKIRVGVDLRIQAAGRDGIAGEWIEPLNKALKDVSAIEEGIDKHIERLGRDHPAATWILETKGISLRMLGRVLSVVGSLDRFANVAKLWRYCFPAGTRVSTPNGAIAIEALRVGDRVIDSNGRATRVTKCFKRSYSGEMVTIRPVGSLAITATAEHPFLVVAANGVRTWKAATDLVKGDGLFLPDLQLRSRGRVRLQPSDHAIRRRPDLAHDIPLTPEVLYLFGRFVGDGAATAWIEKGIHRRGAIQVLFGRAEAEDAEQFQVAARAAFGGANTVEVPGGLRVTFGRATVAEAFQRWFGKGAANKRVPDFIMGCTDESKVRAFIRGYFDADGHIVGPGTHAGTIVANTVSLGLALQLQHLLTRLGVGATLVAAPREKEAVIGGRRCERAPFRYVLTVPKSSLRAIYQEQSASFNRAARKIKRVSDGWIFPVGSILRHHAEIPVFNIRTEIGTYLVQNLAVHNCGYHVTNGKAPRRARGQKTTWAPAGTMVGYRIASTIVKVGGPYREVYDKKRAEYEARERQGPSACFFGHEHKDKAGKIRQCGDAHPHQAAMRYVAKCVLRDLWVHGRRTSHRFISSVPVVRPATAEAPAAPLTKEKRRTTRRTGTSGVGMGKHRKVPRKAHRGKK